MTADLPVYGPTEVFREEDVTADVVVRVAFALSREQLFTALSVGFTELIPSRTPESLTVEETRSEVEGWLHGAAVYELDQYVQQGQLTAYPVEAQPVIDALAAALDRAYPAAGEPNVSPAVQAPRYRDGTVTLQTLDRGEVTIDEPAWCTGHDGEDVGYLADVTHNGAHTTAPIVTARYGPSNIMTAYISHAPHAVQQPEPYPVLSVVLSEHGDFDVPDGRNLARALRIAAARVERALDDLARLRGEGQ